ncbi:GNAT family N-acetyltransferase [Actinophytocola xanthii]|uniref:N-acetyltransferase domain-containing protein n=1 Tax=Actinophytocola xanthii TaxID=1912961 RepID=A0A1Q8CPR6_9PSEU|nr:GNAT family protein [Actinophytocola xanthii]OLF16353.1 hypothetical protein BU204_17375 [Actinophytocola xanthii]
MTGTALSGREILASDGRIAIAELAEGDLERVEAGGDRSLNLGTDDPTLPFRVTRSWAALLDAGTGELLGVMSWRAVPHMATLTGTAWNMGIDLVRSVRRRGLGAAAGRLLARYLFDTTELDRVQAITAIDNVGGWRSLEKAGFTREGVVRGVLRRDDRFWDMVCFSVLRTDLPALDGEREVLARRDEVVLARALPDDHLAVAAAVRDADDALAPDPDQRLPLVAQPVYRGALLGAASGSLLGAVSWRAVDHGGTFGCCAWHLGVEVVPHARGRGVGSTAARLLAEHLFATTELDRVEAAVDAEDLAARRALERAGFRRDGTVRGARVRGGRRRDAVLYGLLRTDPGGP